MQHLGAVVRQLRGLAHVQLRNDARVGDDAGVGREQPRHVLPERDPPGAEPARQQRRGEIGAASTQRRDLAVGRGADEAGDDGDDPLREERLEHALHRAVGAGVVGRRLAEVGIGVDQVERVHESRAGAAGLECRGDQPGAEALATGDEVVRRARRQLAQQAEALGQRLELLEQLGDVEEDRGARLAARQQRTRDLRVPRAEPRNQRRDGARLAGPRLLRHFQERVGGPRHGGDDHDGRLLTMAANDLDRVADGSGIGQRRTAELVDVRRSAGTGHGGESSGDGGGAGRRPGRHGTLSEQNVILSEAKEPERGSAPSLCSG